MTVCVLSARELDEAVCHAREWWGRDEAATHNATFVIAPATPEEIYAEVGQTVGPDYPSRRCLLHAEIDRSWQGDAWLSVQT